MGEKLLLQEESQNLLLQEEFFSLRKNLKIFFSRKNLKKYFFLEREKNSAEKILRFFLRKKNSAEKISFLKQPLLVETRQKLKVSGKESFSKSDLKFFPEFEFFFSFFSSTKMWVLIDNTSKERVSERFSSQAALARFMKLSPQTLNKAVKEGRTVFSFEGRDVQVVKQVFARFEVRDSPRGSVLGRFATQADLANSIGVSRQAVSAACARICNWDERTVLKDGNKIFIFPVFDKSPMTNPWEEDSKPKPKNEHAKSVHITSEVFDKIYPSLAAATRDLKIDSKTISAAVASGRNKFRRKSDGQEFQVKVLPKPIPISLPPKAVGAPLEMPKPPPEEKEVDYFEKNWERILKEFDATPREESEEVAEEDRIIFCNLNNCFYFKFENLLDYAAHFARYFDRPRPKEEEENLSKGQWSFEAKPTPWKTEKWRCVHFVSK